MEQIKLFEYMFILLPLSDNVYFIIINLMEKKKFNDFVNE